MKSGLQLLPPGRNGCGNPRSRGRKVKSGAFTCCLGQSVETGAPLSHWLHHHRSPFSWWLLGSIRRTEQRVRRTEQCLLSWLPVLFPLVHADLPTLLHFQNPCLSYSSVRLGQCKHTSLLLPVEELSQHFPVCKDFP